MAPNHSKVFKESSHPATQMRRNS